MLRNLQKLLLAGLLLLAGISKTQTFSLPKMRRIDSKHVLKAVEKDPYLAFGFSGDTLVCTPYGQVPISSLSTHCNVVSMNHKNQLWSRRVTHISKIKVPRYLAIEVDGQVIKTAPMQRFWDARFGTRGFRLAVEFEPQKQPLLGVNEQSRPQGYSDYPKEHNSFISHQIEAMGIVEEEIELFIITVENTHNFMVTKHNLLAHNFVPFAFGITFVFGDGIIVLESIHLAAIFAGFFGIGIGFTAYANRRHFEHVLVDTRTGRVVREVIKQTKEVIHDVVQEVVQTTKSTVKDLIQNRLQTKPEPPLAESNPGSTQAQNQAGASLKNPSPPRYYAAWVDGVLYHNVDQDFAATQAKKYNQELPTCATEINRSWPLENYSQAFEVDAAPPLNEYLENCAVIGSPPQAPGQGKFDSPPANQEVFANHCAPQIDQQEPVLPCCGGSKTLQPEPSLGSCGTGKLNDMSPPTPHCGTGKLEDNRPAPGCGGPKAMEKIKPLETHPYEPLNPGCNLGQQSGINLNCRDIGGPTKGDQGPVVGNIEQMLDSTPLGEILRGKVEKLRGVLGKDGAVVYIVKVDIPSLRLKKDNVFCLDKQHRNEIEVFVESEQDSLQKLVINTNGKIDEKKTTKAIDKKRKFIRWGGK